MKTEDEELDDIIQDILGEDEFEPKFPESKKHKVASVNEVAPKNNRPGKTEKKIDKKTDKLDHNEKKKQVAQKTTKVGSAKSEHVEMAIKITRYVILGSAILFFMSLFFGWFSLSGNAVNQGYIRGEETVKFMDRAVQQYKAENLVQYEYELVTFSAKDLFSFSNVMEEDYLTVMEVDKTEKNSIAAMIHSYYMKAVILLFAMTLTAIAILLVFKRHKGIEIVRNLAVFNWLIIGLNYMALKIPYFSMFAINAKDVLNQSVERGSISMTRDGIAFGQTFYPYIMTEESGLYVAAFFLTVWLVLSIVLCEVRNREKELAIENGDL